MQPADHRAFNLYLETQTDVSDRHRPYYLSGVRRFVASYPDVDRLHRQKALIAYDTELTKRFENWQVKQAVQAVRYYWSLLDMREKITTTTTLGVEDAQVLAESVFVKEVVTSF